MFLLVVNFFLYLLNYFKVFGYFQILINFLLIIVIFCIFFLKVNLLVGEQDINIQESYRNFIVYFVQSVCMFGDEFVVDVIVSVFVLLVLQFRSVGYLGDQIDYILV